MTDTENYDELFELARKAGKGIKSETDLIHRAGLTRRSHARTGVGFKSAAKPAPYPPPRGQIHTQPHS